MNQHQSQYEHILRGYNAILNQQGIQVPVGQIESVVISSAPDGEMFSIENPRKTEITWVPELPPAEEPKKINFREFL